jgi:hypothetical protein
MTDELLSYDGLNEVYTQSVINHAILAMSYMVLRK